VIGFFNSYRQQYPVSRDVLHEAATQFQNWVVNRSQKWGAPILDTPEDRRDKFLDPYFRNAKPNQVVAIVKGREPARIMIAIGNKKEDRWHLQFAQRWIVQYNFYINDERWGRMFVRMCPYLNTLHLMIRMVSRMLIGGNGLPCRGRSGKLVILRFTPRGFRRLRLDPTRSWSSSSSTEL
jgi:hypothetical protein